MEQNILFPKNFCGKFYSFPQKFAQNKISFENSRILFCSHFSKEKKCSHFAKVKKFSHCEKNIFFTFRTKNCFAILWEFFLVHKIIFCKILGNKTEYYCYFTHIFFVQQNIVFNFCNKIFLSPNSKRKFSSHFRKEYFLHIFEKNIFFIFFNRIFFSQISNIFLFSWKNSMWKKNSFPEIFGEQNILLQRGTEYFVPISGTK